MNQPLANLLSLQQELREQININELAFFIAHQTRMITSYQRAVVWSSNNNKHISIHSISGVTQLDKYSPYQQNLNKFLTALGKQNKQSEACSRTFIKTEFTQDIQDIWPQDLPENLIYYRFDNTENETTGGYLIAKNELPNEHESKQLEWLSDAYNYSWQSLIKPKNFLAKITHNFGLKKVIITSSVILILALMFVRIPQSVLAPAVITAKKPYVVTTPMEGVVEIIDVKPDQKVQSDQLLFSMEKRDLSNANELAKRELATALARYKKAVHTGFKDIKNRADINILKAEIKEKELEVAYTDLLIRQSNVTAPVSGIVIIDNPEKWTGKPVTTGEKVLEIADPKQIEIEIFLPVSDAINFKVNDSVKLFLNADPLSPLQAKVAYASFDAAITSEQILAYRIIANMDAGQDLARIGSQGTAKIMGQNVSLFYYIFRKPITTLRQTIGW